MSTSVDTTLAENASITDATIASDNRESAASTIYTLSSLNFDVSKWSTFIIANYPLLVMLVLLLLVSIISIRIYSQVKSQKRLMELLFFRLTDEQGKREEQPTILTEEEGTLSKEIEADNQEQGKQKLAEAGEKSTVTSKHAEKEKLVPAEEKVVSPEEQHGVDDEKLPEDDLENLYHKLDKLTKS